MHVNFVPQLPPSGGYENIVTAMDRFSRDLSAYPTSSPDAKTIAKFIITIMTKYACLPTTIISDKSAVFMSRVIKEVAKVFGNTLQYATTKHAQNIGMLERTHASLKKTLTMEKGEEDPCGLSISTLQFWNTTLLNTHRIGCEHSKDSHRRVPYKVLDLKMRIRPQRMPTPNSQIAEDVLKQTKKFFHDVRKNTIQAYIKYKAYYDKKKPMPPNSKNKNMCMFYSLRQIIREV